LIGRLNYVEDQAEILGTIDGEIPILFPLETQNIPVERIQLLFDARGCEQVGVIDRAQSHGRAVRASGAAGRLRV